MLPYKKHFMTFRMQTDLQMLHQCMCVTDHLNAAREGGIIIKAFISPVCTTKLYKTVTFTTPTMPPCGVLVTITMCHLSQIPSYSLKTFLNGLCWKEQSSA